MDVSMRFGTVATSNGGDFCTDVRMQERASKNRLPRVNNSDLCFERGNMLWLGTVTSGTTWIVAQPSVWAKQLVTGKAICLWWRPASPPILMKHGGRGAHRRKPMRVDAWKEMVGTREGAQSPKFKIKYTCTRAKNENNIFKI